MVSMPTINPRLSSLTSYNLNCPVCLLIAIIVGAGAGAIGGLKIGAADIGKEMAGSMGAFSGLSLPGVLLALIILKLID